MTFTLFFSSRCKRGWAMPPAFAPFLMTSLLVLIGIWTTGFLESSPARFPITMQPPSCIDSFDVVVVFHPDSPYLYHIQAMNARQLDSSFPSGARLLRMPSCGTINFYGASYSYSNMNDAVGRITGGMAAVGVSNNYVVIASPNQDDVLDNGTPPLPPNYFTCRNTTDMQSQLQISRTDNSQKVVVGVIDGGIDTNNNYLRSKISHKVKVIPDSISMTIQDSTGHSTFCTGTISRFMGNNDSIHIYKALEQNKGNVFFVIKSIDQATNNGVNIISMSFGGHPNGNYSSKTR